MNFLEKAEQRREDEAAQAADYTDVRIHELVAELRSHPLAMRRVLDMLIQEESTDE